MVRLVLERPCILVVQALLNVLATPLAFPPLGNADLRIVRADGTQVATVDATRKAGLRRIHVGHDCGERFEVVEGLVEFDRLALAATALRDHAGGHRRCAEHHHCANRPARDVPTAVRGGPAGAGAGGAAGIGNVRREVRDCMRDGQADR